MSLLGLDSPEAPKPPLFLPETLGVVLRRWIKASLEQYREWILVFIGAYLFGLLLFGGWLWNRHWNHSECVEALKLRTEGAVVMGLCGK
jgi:hypothetical protein